MSSTFDFRGLGAILSASVLGLTGSVPGDEAELCVLEPLDVFCELLVPFGACGNGTDESWGIEGASVLTLAVLDGALAFFFCFFLDGFDVVEAGSVDADGRY